MTTSPVVPIPTTLISKSDLLDELHELAKKTYGITDLNQLEKEMDLYCLTKLRISIISSQQNASTSVRSPSGSAPSGSAPSGSQSQSLLIFQRLQKDANLLKVTKSHITDTFLSYNHDTDMNYLINHFIENNHLYEEELKDKLNIIFSLQQSDELIQAKHLEEERKQWYADFTSFTENIAYYSILIGLPVVVMSVLLKN
jgi:hypothetical protein